MSATTLPMRTTIFADTKASTATPGPATWGELIKLAENPSTYASKVACPLIKLATFGELRSPSGSLRHNRNVMAVAGIEGDYDAGALTPQQLAATLREADAQALVVTTPSHNQPGKGSRMRIFAPLSTPCTPAERERYVGALNGILGGVLAPESFTLSQTYYFGRVEGVDYEVIHVNGANFIDELALVVKLTAPKTNARAATSAPRGDNPDPMSLSYKDKVGTPAQGTRNLLAQLDPDCSYDTWLKVGMSLQHEYGDEGLALWRAWSAGGKKYPGDAEIESKWASFRGGEGTPITLRYVMKLVKAQTAEAKPTGALFQATSEAPLLSFLSLAEITTQPMAEVVQGLLAYRGLTVVGSVPNAGKTFFLIDAALHIAAGETWMGRKVRQGPVVYLAAEAPGSAEMRAKAAADAKFPGQKLPFYVIIQPALLGDEGACNGAVERIVATVRCIEEREGALVVALIVDTVAASLGTGEENGDGMIRLAQGARRVAETLNVAVALAHHPSKATRRVCAAIRA